MQRTRPQALVAACVLAASLGLAGCGSTPEAESPEEDRVIPDVELVSEGRLLTCTHLPYPPFQYEEDGEVVGFDVDIVDLIADELAVDQAIVDMPFDGIQNGAALDGGECDIAAAAMTITEPRGEVVDFAYPYFNAAQALLVERASPVRGLEGMHGMRLAIQEGTTGAAFVEEYNAEHGNPIELVYYTNLSALTQSLRSDETDGVVSDNGPLHQFAEVYRDTEVVAEFDTDEQYGLAVRKGNTELLDVVNRVLEEARTDGRYEEIHLRWFGVTPNQW
ncbi:MULTISPECIES: ABC transporter substrate-binding protein [Actinoalloteichus]|uniref:Periplasmic component of amino acid ABC-type transporter/signal transduction system n=1 Tax=Actinoalloteichus fjordicus TaxID=1612552 RepID=A0AAC9LJT3_9PSEU|nr:MULTISPECIES: ABC transporter substrate-binding protein [Actinoalloteichus]APU17972.1 periplasmic component of amino acid ABC-type transporter/signal transduction system [Actinoalloteichus fjordicus]APU24051.1 periplasmic component of amino acid ABC-type transporter/signal transduction system [Actinoalloteichus sp. GBA129-24]